jgi:hypothetical protein
LVHPIRSESTRAAKINQFRAHIMLQKWEFFENSLKIGKSREPAKTGRIDPGKTETISGHATRIGLDRKSQFKKTNPLTEKRSYRAQKTHATSRSISSPC